MNSNHENKISLKRSESGFSEKSYTRSCVALATMMTSMTFS
jgi:hypothetical protein